MTIESIHGAPIMSCSGTGWELTEDRVFFVVTNYMFSVLPQWASDPTRKIAKCKINEKRLNSQLCSFLNTHVKRPHLIQFLHESPDEETRSNDLAVMPFFSNGELSIYQPLIPIECKRLPAPRNERQKEYVTGLSETKTTGGIQRFKTGDHGRGHSHAILVGYVEKYGFVYWENCVNAWIRELDGKTMPTGETWYPDEQLDEKDSNSDAAKYSSKHVRVFKGTRCPHITIIHLWVKMPLAHKKK